MINEAQVLLDVGFFGTFTSTNGYTLASAGEAADGAVMRRTGAESADPARGLLMGGWTQGLEFHPRVPEVVQARGRMLRLEMRFVLDANEAQPASATLVTIPGGPFARLRGDHVEIGVGPAGGEAHQAGRDIPRPWAGVEHVLSLTWARNDDSLVLQAVLDEALVLDTTTRDVGVEPEPGQQVIAIGGAAAEHDGQGFVGTIRRVGLWAYEGQTDPRDLPPAASEGPPERSCPGGAEPAGAIAPAPRIALRPGETPASVRELAGSVVPTEAQVSWQRHELATLIHFGLNTFTGDEWGSGSEPPSVFEPSRLDTDQWARTLYDAGIKLALLTAKHHDGFLLFRSRYSRYGVASTGWGAGGGDVVRDFASSMRAHGIRVGLYLSPADENQYRSAGGTYANGSALRLRRIPTLVAGDDRASAVARGDLPTFDLPLTDYGAFYANQLYELLTEYGPIDEVWLDGAPGHIPPDDVESYPFAAWYDVVHSLQPDALVAISGPDIRWVGNESGVARENEWSVVPSRRLPTGQRRVASAEGDSDPRLGSSGQLADCLAMADDLCWWPSESDTPLTDGWFWAPEHRVRTAAELLDLYRQTVGRNSLLLLGIAPDSEGLVPDDQATALCAFRQLRERTYSADLARAARAVGGDGAPAPAANDGDLDSAWSAVSPDDASVTLEFDAVVGADSVLLAEDIRQGQRIESLAVDVDDGARWSTIATAGTVGALRILSLGAVIHARRWRVRVTASRGPATLARFSLYRAG